MAALREEVAAQHGSHPTSRDRKEAQRLHQDWAAACLDGLDDDEATMIKWIRVSGGRRPMLAAELARAGITPKELPSDWAIAGEKMRDGRVCSNAFEIVGSTARRQSWLSGSGASSTRRGDRVMKQRRGLSLSVLHSTEPIRRRLQPREGPSRCRIALLVGQQRHYRFGVNMVEAQVDSSGRMTEVARGRDEHIGVRQRVRRETA